MILVRFTGGLGNQMFQYAFAKSLALRQQIELKFDDSLLGEKKGVENLVVRHFDLDIFDLEEQWASKEDIAIFNGYENPTLAQRLKFKVSNYFGRFPLIVQKGHEYNLQQIKGIGHSACLIGRWQSEDFFSQFSQQIKDIFSFNSFTPNEYSANIAKKMKSGISVSIQVRRGDYVSNPLYAKSIGALDELYFLNAISKMREKLVGKNEKITFYFISDDIEWCKRTFSHLDSTFFVEQEHSKVGYISDMWLLTQCQHAIISNSTFSWWGAWLGEQKESVVIAPHLWTREEDTFNSHFVPDRWIRIDNNFEPLV